MIERYPNLFQEAVWSSGPTTIQFMVGEPPPEKLISNINGVPVTQDGQFVIIQLDDGKWEVPGGTIESGESPLKALERELMEEAGAQLISARYVGAWKMLSHAEKPFRPHLPDPIAYRVVYRCMVDLVTTPQIPDLHGENVVAVRAVAIDEATQYFSGIGRDDLAELYQFVAALNVTQG